MKDVSIQELKTKATEMRIKVVDMIYKAQSGPPAGPSPRRTLSPPATSST